jgi:DNA-binding response OmpR family regulator
MRLLVVEDEAKTANFLAKGLGESGFAVDVALNGLDGRYFIEQGSTAGNCCSWFASAAPRRCCS